MNIHSIRHVPFEGLGRIEDWALSRGHQLSSTAIYDGEVFPDLDKLDWLIIMGGPMGAYDKAEYPWIVEELKFIESAIQHGKTVVGICLGVQLLAEVLGSEVYKGDPGMEIGWSPVRLTSEGIQSPFLKDFPMTFSPLHWHGDTFDIPRGAKHLISGDLYSNQSFSYGEKVVGLQFHLEFCARCVDRLSRAVGEDLQPGPSVMSEQDIQARDDLFLASELLLQKFLDNVAEV